MISVAMSAINPGKMGVSAIRSCLASLPENSEVLLHLDPGEDGQRELLRRIKNPKFRLIETEEKQGFAQGLNLAISEAKFEFIARIDADDLALPWRWRYQLAGIRKADFHFGSLMHLFRVFELPVLIPHFPVSLNSKEFAAVASHRNPGFHPAAMFRKSAFLELGGYRPALAEDYDLWLRASSGGYRIYRGRLPVTVYRHHPSQATAQPDWDDLVEKDPLIAESKRRNEFAFEGLGLSESCVIKKLKVAQPLARLEFRDLK